MASIENIDDEEIVILSPVKSLFKSLYPVTSIDRPIPLTELELSWIDAFNLLVLDIVLKYPHRFERYLEKQLYETYRRRLFVYWMNTMASRQFEIEKRELEARLELKRLMSRRRELSQIACNDGWDPHTYD